MAITSISRDWGSEPSIVRITATNTLAEITTTDYLLDEADSIDALQNGEFEWLEGDLVAINYSNGEGFFTRDAVNNTFDALPASPGSLSDTLQDGDIFVGSAANVATGVTPSGDITLTNAGVFGIAAGAIVNADVNAAAAIAYSKLATLASGNILVGSAGGVPTSVAMTGDVAIVASGATTIQAGAIDLAMLSTGIAPAGVIKFMGQVTSVGGAAAEAFAVAGALAASDRAFVQVVNNGTGNVTALQAVVTNDTLTVTFSADPQNDTVINYQIIRAAA